MSKKKRDAKAAKDLRLTGNEMIELEDGSIAIAFHRSRKARRAQARIDGYVWKALGPKDRLLQ